MFNPQSNLSFFRQRDTYKSQNHQTYQKKNIQFHQNIRKKQIQQKMKCMRQQILASLSQDYYALKGINLSDTLLKLSQLKEEDFISDWQDIDRIIKDVFIYSRSDQSDHLYYLIDDKVILKLTKMLHISNIQAFNRNPRTYIRILWIIANYTTYVSESIDNYHQVLFSIQLCKHTFFTLFLELTDLPYFYQLQKEYKIFTHVQARQILYLVLFSINNISVNRDILVSICFKPNKQTSFVNNLMKEFTKLTAFARLNNIKDTLVSDILCSLINIFQNILKLNLQNVQAMLVISELNFTIVNMILQLLSFTFHEQKQLLIQLQITLALRYFLDTHLQDNPSVVINHNFNILFQMFASISQKLYSINDNIINYDSMLQIEGVTKESLSSFKKQSAQLQKRLLQILQILIGIFRINLPDQDNNQIYDTYIDWLQRILPIFKKVFAFNDTIFDQIRYKMLILLCDACLEQDFCDIIMEELYIMNIIFYYVRSQCVQVRIKKAALNVLNSIICISLEGQSDLRIHVISMLRNNKILQIFSHYIGEYVDEELNKKLLHSLMLYLRTETAEDSQDHIIWAQFCQQGGDKRLQRYQSFIRNNEIRQIIEAILFEFNSL